MVDIKGYWLSVGLCCANGGDNCDLTKADELDFTVKIDGCDPLISCEAHEYKDAVLALKNKIKILKMTEPEALPQPIHFDDGYQDSLDDIGHIFVSEDELTGS